MPLLKAGICCGMLFLTGLYCRMQRAPAFVSENRLTCPLPPLIRKHPWHRKRKKLLFQLFILAMPFFWYQWHRTIKTSSFSESHICCTVFLMRGKRDPSLTYRVTLPSKEGLSNTDPRSDPWALTGWRLCCLCVLFSGYSWSRRLLIFRRCRFWEEVTVPTEYPLYLTHCKHGLR